MLDILAQFDALGIGLLIGSLLFLAGLIRVLVDNRSFEELNRRHEAVKASFPAEKGPAAASGDYPDPGRSTPTRPARPPRAA